MPKHTHLTELIAAALVPCETDEARVEAIERLVRGHYTNRFRALLRLHYPDDMNPFAKRSFDKVLDDLDARL